MSFWIGGEAVLYLSSFFLVCIRANSPVPPHRMAESTWSDRLPWGILFPHTGLRRSFCVSPETWVFSSSIETRLSVRRTLDIFQAFGLFDEKSPSGQWNVHRSLKASLGTVRVVNVNHQKSAWLLKNWQIGCPLQDCFSTQTSIF